MEATELGIVTLAFGVNILVALVSIRYPRPPFPPLRTPSKPAADVTPVRRPIKGLGTSPVRCILHGRMSPLIRIHALDIPTFQKVIR